jgi:hypothetical protein
MAYESDIFAGLKAINLIVYMIDFLFPTYIQHTSYQINLILIRASQFFSPIILIIDAPHQLYLLQYQLGLFSMNSIIQQLS